MDWFPLYNSIRIAVIATALTFVLGVFFAEYPQGKALFLLILHQLRPAVSHRRFIGGGKLLRAQLRLAHAGQADIGAVLQIFEFLSFQSTVEVYRVFPQHR